MNNQKEVKFTQKTLQDLLEEISDEYFSEDTAEYGLGLWDVIDAVKNRYDEEISSLPNL